MAILGAFIKQPKEIEVYTIIFKNDLEKIDYLNDATAFLEIIKTSDEDFTTDSNNHPINDSKDLKILTYYIYPDRINIWLGQGVEKTTYKVTCRVSANRGRVLEDEFKIKIKDF